MMEEIKYKPSDISKTNERNVKSPLIEEYNLMGAKFKDGKISQKEWTVFIKSWEKRLEGALNIIVKDRIYENEGI